MIDADFIIDAPQCVKDAVGSYREDNDWLGRFLIECCEVDKSYREKSGELYKEYRRYCLAAGEFARSTTDFYGSIDQAGFERKKTKTGIIIIGLRIKIDDFLE